MLHKKIRERIGLIVRINHGFPILFPLEFLVEDEGSSQEYKPHLSFLGIASQIFRLKPGMPLLTNSV